MIENQGDIREANESLKSDLGEMKLSLETFKTLQEENKREMKSNLETFKTLQEENKREMKSIKESNDI